MILKKHYVYRSKEWVLGGNEKMGELAYGKDYPLLDLMRNKKDNLCFMENKKVKVIDMENHYRVSEKSMQFICKTDKNNPTIFWTGYTGNGYDKVNGALSPSNDALYIGSVIKQLYDEWYGYQVLTKPDKSPMQLVMRVHFGQIL